MPDVHGRVYICSGIGLSPVMGYVRAVGWVIVTATGVLMEAGSVLLECS